MNNLLKNHRCYLAGPIDRCPNLGIDWRNYISNVLRQRYNAIPYNPMDKPLQYPIADEHEKREERKNWKKEGRLDLLKDFLWDIRHVDLRMTDRSDWGIFYIDLDIHSCGTYEELTRMNMSKKPCLTMCKQGVLNTPDWIVGKLPLENIFGNWEDLISYMDKVNSGEIKDTRRWVFFSE